jgi:hypothetical protein
MHYNISLFGTPIGSIDVELAGLVIAPFTPLAGYASIRDSVRHSSRRLDDLGFFSDKPARMAAEALAPSSEMTFELREYNGALVKAEFVNVVEAPAGIRPLAIVKLHGANAAIESLMRSLPRSPGYGERPEA